MEHGCPFCKVSARQGRKRDHCHWNINDSKSESLNEIGPKDIPKCQIHVEVRHADASDHVAREPNPDSESWTKFGEWHDYCE